MRLLSVDAVNVNHVSGYNGTALHMAVVLERTTILKEILKLERLDVNAVCVDNATALSVAAAKCSAGMVSLLLTRASIDVNRFNSRGETPLLRVSLRNCTSVVKVLLERTDCDLNSSDITGQTPLIAAARRGYVAVVDILLSHPNASVNERTTERRMSALSLAVVGRHTSVALRLIRHPGVDVNLRSEDGNTCLHLACFLGQMEIVQLLVARKDIGLNLPNRQRLTPYHYAERQGHRAIASLIRNHEYFVNISDR